MSDLPEVKVTKEGEKEPEAFAAPPEEKKVSKKKATKKPRKKRFLVASEEGAFVCEEDALLATLEGKTSPEVFLVDKKLKSIEVIPGKVDVLSGESEADKLSIKYD